MLKIYVFILFSTLAVFSSSVGAVTLDFRHDFKHHTEQHENRIKISDSIGMFYYGLETKFSATSEDDGSQSAFSDLGRGDSEIDWGLKFSLDENWHLQPGIPVAFGDDNYSLKPQFLVGYKMDNIPLTTSLRYRRQYTRYTEGKGDDFVQNKVTFNTLYSSEKYKYWFEVNYDYNEDEDIYNNGKEAYDIIVGVGRQVGSWLPYIDFSDIGVGSNTDTRQLKSRIGIKYFY